MAAFTSFDTALLVLKGLNGEKISLQDYLAELGLVKKEIEESKDDTAKLKQMGIKVIKVKKQDGI